MGFESTLVRVALGRSEAAESKSLVQKYNEREDIRHAKEGQKNLHRSCNLEETKKNVHSFERFAQIETAAEGNEFDVEYPRGSHIGRAS